MNGPARVCSLCAGKSSAAGSEYDGESVGSGDFGSRASGGGGRRGQRNPDFDEVLEVDPFEAACELLFEKRWGWVGLH